MLTAVQHLWSKSYRAIVLSASGTFVVPWRLSTFDTLIGTLVSSSLEAHVKSTFIMRWRFRKTKRDMLRGISRVHNRKRSYRPFIETYSKCWAELIGLVKRWKNNSNDTKKLSIARKSTFFHLPISSCLNPKWYFRFHSSSFCLGSVSSINRGFYISSIDPQTIMKIFVA